MEGTRSGHLTLCREPSPDSPHWLAQLLHKAPAMLLYPSTVIVGRVYWIELGCGQDLQDTSLFLAGDLQHTTLCSLLCTLQCRQVDYGQL